MTNVPQNNLERWLKLVEQDQLDDLTPDQVAQLERYLNERPAAAQRLAARRPALAPSLPPAAPVPNDAQWNAAWSRIDSRRDADFGRAVDADKAAGRVPCRARPRRVFTLWHGIAAAAACIVLVVSWSVFRTSNGGRAPIQPATHARIDNLEVFGDRTAIVMSAGEDDPFPVIWVMDNEGA